MKKKMFGLAVLLWTLLAFVGCNVSGENDGKTNNQENEETVYYTVSFESNGGSTVSEQIIESGYCATKPSAPEKNGFSFIAWYSDRSLTMQFDFNTKITENIKLYAKWEEKSLIPQDTYYTVSFDVDGGTAVSSQRIEQGKCAVSPANPSKSGYTFVAWCSDSSLTTEFKFDTAINSDIKLYAKWERINYTVNFETNGGNIINSIVVDKGSLLSRPNTPERKGYVFESWYTDAELTFEFSFDSPISEDITLYAKWSEKEIAGGIVILSRNNSDINVTHIESEGFVSFTADAGFDKYSWYIDTLLMLENTNMYSIDLSTLSKGVHELFLMAEKKSAVYSYRTSLIIK